MGKLVVALDGVVIKEVQLTKEKTTLGRRPYNDIVIDNLAVSGEHAVLQRVGTDVFIDDLNSTNGTYINGKAIKKQLLARNDTVEIGKYKIRFVVDESSDLEKTLILGSPAPAAAAYGPAATSGFGGLPTAALAASIKVLNGAAAGREVVLTKVVTTVGKPGCASGFDHQTTRRLRLGTRGRRHRAQHQRCPHRGRIRAFAQR